MSDLLQDMSLTIDTMIGGYIERQLVTPCCKVTSKLRKGDSVCARCGQTVTMSEHLPGKVLKTGGRKRRR